MSNLGPLKKKIIVFFFILSGVFSLCFGERLPKYGTKGIWGSLLASFSQPTKLFKVTVPKPELNPVVCSSLVILRLPEPSAILRGP